MSVFAVKTNASRGLKMFNMKVRCARSLQGTVRVPGDKSISHRAAILAAMAEGQTLISNFSEAADCQSTLSCLQALGVRISRSENIVTITGVGKRGFQKPDGPLDCGNSGTTARLLTGVLAGQSFDSVITGDASLSARPMGRIIKPLRKMGAQVEADGGRLPIRISGDKSLASIEYRPDIASAQVKSCVLLAGLLADSRTALIEDTATRDHTERMLEWLGVEVETATNYGSQRISVSGDSVLVARDINIPGDISSAAYFLAAGVCLPDSDVTIPNVGLNATRSAILEFLRMIGGSIDVLDQMDISNEPRGTLRVLGGVKPSGETVVRGPAVPQVIDEIPILAVIGTQLTAGLEVRDAAELRHKETDRIAAVVENLRRMNGIVDEFPDGFRVERSDLKGASLDPFGDHRIAMAFAIAGLLAEAETEIADPGCVDISFPGFFDTLADVVR